MNTFISHKVKTTNIQVKLLNYRTVYMNMWHKAAYNHTHSHIVNIETREEQLCLARHGLTRGHNQKRHIKEIRVATFPKIWTMGVERD